MGLIAEWLRRIAYLLNRRRHQDVLRVEMESHRAMMADPRSFGNTLRWREESQDVWGWTRPPDVGRDLPFAARPLRRSPGVPVVAVLSLALATGATTAI